MGEILAILAASVTIIRGFGEAIKKLSKSIKKPELQSSKPQLLESINDNNEEKKETKVENDAKSQIAQRLTYLLDLFNQNRNSKITISEIAEFCGYSKTSDLEKYFFGLEEPCKEEKEKICSCLGLIQIG